MDVASLARQEVKKISRPKHGGDIWQFFSYNDYSSNLNPLGPPADLLDIISEAVGLLQYYPDDQSSRFKEAICEHHGVPMNCVIAGAGSSELIRLFPEVFLRPGEEVLMPRPTFGEYAFSCRMMGANIVEYQLPEQEGFVFDFPEMLTSLNGHTKAVYICNPNNPTSRATPRKRILEFVEECERKSVLVFLDETLLDLTDGSKEITCVQEAPSHDNLFLIRSLTKSFAIPGMRIGYGIGGKDLIELMDKARLTWNLGSLEQLVGADLLENHHDHVTKACSLIFQEKEMMQHALSSSLSLGRPDSCFFFSDMSRVGMTGGEFRQEMMRHRILVRDCASFGPPCDRYARFCIKTREQNLAFLEAFRNTLEG